MGSQADIWSIALLIVVAFGVGRVYAQGLGWRWGRDLYLHFGLVGGIAAAGLAGVAPVACAAIAWTALLAPTFATRAAQRRLTTALATYDLAGARRWAGVLRLAPHGPIRRLAAAQLQALEATLAGDHAAAEGPLLAFEAPDVPASLRREARGMRLLVRLHARDWAGIVMLGEAMALQRGGVTPELGVHVVRAFLEAGLVDEAAEWLGRMRREEGSVDVAADLSAVPVYALLGALPELEAALARVPAAQVPEISRAYWRGRCLHARGERAAAQAELARGLALVPPELAVLARRFEEALAAAEDGSDGLGGDRAAGAEGAAHARALAAARATFEEARATAELVQGRWGRLPRVLAALVAGPSLVLLAGLDGWLPRLSDTAEWLFAHGALWAPAVWTGEWWRLVAHMGLHAHLTHLVLNLVALLWLGSRALPLFGSAAVFAAFLAGGAAGGLAHVVVAPAEVAVGASGGVLALLGLMAAGWLRARGLLPERLRRRLLLEMAAIIGIQLLFDQIVPQVAAVAHAGGLAAGAVLGALWPLSPARRVDGA